MENCRNISGGDISNHLRDEERRHTARTVLQQGGMLTAECLNASDARTDGTTESTGIHILVNHQSTVRHCLSCGGDGIQGIFVIVANHRLVDIEVFRIEVQYLCGDFHRKILSIESFYGVNGTGAFKEVVPECIHIVAKRCDTS